MRILRRGAPMTANKRARLDRAISEKRGEWMTSGIQMNKAERNDAFRWSSDWRYAGVLLEELLDGNVPADGEARFVRRLGDSWTEAIALAWCKENGVTYEP